MQYTRSYMHFLKFREIVLLEVEVKAFIGFYVNFKLLAVHGMKLEMKRRMIEKRC